LATRRSRTISNRVQNSGVRPHLAARRHTRWALNWVINMA